MNRIKLQYLRWKNKSKWVYKRKNKDITIADIFYSIQPTNTYPGWLHNNLKMYKAMKMNPKSKIMKTMFMETHLNLFASKSRWKFARQIYEQIQEKLQENAKR